MSGLLDRFVAWLFHSPNPQIATEYVDPVPASDEEMRLVEAVGRGELDTAFDWICPINGGIAMAADNIRDMPCWLRNCARCGQDHFFQEHDINVRFVPVRSDVRSDK